MTHRISCALCYRPRFHCYCEQITRRENRYPIKLIQTKEEAKHPFNTGRIAQLSLSKCETLQVNAAGDIDSWLNDWMSSDPVLAFPSQASTPVALANITVNTPIIFLDDTWRKAKRFLYENPMLNGLPKICLPEGFTSTYRLRKTGKHTENKNFKNSEPVSTIESIAACLSILEQRPGYYQNMLDILDWMTNKQLEYTQR
jgi:DTW domain-containing protein YfiP